MAGPLAREPRRAPPVGSAFIRSLAALDSAEVHLPPQAFAQRLSRWIAWTDAISLSAALNEGPRRPAAAAPGRAQALQAAERELSRLRADLAQRIAEALADAALPPPGGALPEFASYRRSYVACQQALATQIAALRRQVREAVVQAVPALAPLAALDGLLERALGAREQALLATVTGRLEARFEQLIEAQPAAPADALAPLRHEMQSLLRAELDLRLQPVDGLLEAARPSLSDRHA